MIAMTLLHHTHRVDIHYFPNLTNSDFHSKFHDMIPCPVLEVAVLFFVFPHNLENMQRPRPGYWITL